MKSTRMRVVLLPRQLLSVVRISVSMKLSVPISSLSILSVHWSCYIYVCLFSYQSHLPTRSTSIDMLVKRLCRGTISKRRNNHGISVASYVPSGGLNQGLSLESPSTSTMVPALKLHWFRGFPKQTPLLETFFLRCSMMFPFGQPEKPWHIFHVLARKTP